MTRITRRRLLVVAGGAVGAVVLSCGGLFYAGMRQPQVSLARGECGKDENVTQILVAYASKCGSTGEIADAIAQSLCEAGAAVDVRPMQDTKDLDGYDAIVVGSAIRMGRPLQEATRFVEKHAATLNRVPVAFFAGCMALSDPTEENLEQSSAYLEPLRQLVTPVDESLFAGVMDPSKLPWLFPLMMKAMDLAEGDHRDWDAIRAWGGDLAPKLLQV